MVYRTAEHDLPGGPQIHATSVAARQNRTARFWLSFRSGSKNVMSVPSSCEDRCGEGGVRHRRTRRSGGMDLSAETIDATVSRALSIL